MSEICQKSPFFAGVVRQLRHVVSRETSVSPVVVDPADGEIHRLDPVYAAWDGLIVVFARSDSRVVEATADAAKHYLAVEMLLDIWMTRGRFAVSHRKAMYSEANNALTFGGASFDTLAARACAEIAYKFLCNAKPESGG